MSNYQLLKGYKQTEVGVIPEDWEVLTLSEMCLKIQDGTHFSPSLGGTDYLYITSKNIGRGFLKLENAERIDESEHRKIYGRCDVKKGDLLLTKDGVNTGNSALNTLDEEFSLLSSVAFLRFDSNKYDANHFLQQILSSDGQNRMKDLMSGNAITRLTLEKIHKIPFPVPPLAEQRTIAATLSDVDALIAALDKLIAKKHHLKTATMQQLLTGKKRLPGFGEGKWSTRQQKEVCSYINGRAYQRTEWETFGTPVVRLQNLTGSGDKYYYSTLNLPEHQYMDYGDLIFMWSASFGPYIWNGSKAIYHYHIWKIDCDKERVDKNFYYYKLVELTDNIKKGSNGSTMAHVTKGGMENFSIILPEDVAEQRAIATVLSDMDTDIAALETRRTKTQAIKQGMMQQLLTGKVRLV